jgi:very-short-patch-repair endonuclease
LTPADYHALASKRGYEWLGSTVISNRTKTEWRCACGNIFLMPYDKLQAGRGCPICRNAKRIADRRLKPEDYHALAQSKGHIWLGPEVANNRTKTNWQCQHGHRWAASYSSVILGTCPKCSTAIVTASRRRKPDDYHTLATSRGFSWLGPEVLRNNIKTRWQCAKAHVWEAGYNDIQSGNGCPFCCDMVNGQRVSKPQRAICEMVNGEMNVRFKQRHSVDIAITVEGVRIAIEYDSWLWHYDKLEHDKRKTRALILAGWRVLRVKSNALLPSKRQLDNAIRRLVSGESYTEIVLKDWGVKDYTHS